MFRLGPIVVGGKMNRQTTLLYEKNFGWVDVSELNSERLVSLWLTAPAT
jgi:hypothetical protein